ncbi:class I SAM-dependent methyltransferase [Pseudonocardia humida]|uniref:class I SAM-dependent methyltransferase n=1 Tax=Pseudonocardia humida TaxID=2800819 RepID=UPI003556FA0B
MPWRSPSRHGECACSVAGDVEGDVVASLVLHYLEDWTAPLAELRRVLRPAGRLIASVEAPFRRPDAGRARCRLLRDT